MTVIVIPARLGSTRLQRKMLLPGPDGRPLIKITYDNAKLSKAARKVIVATDAPEISELFNPKDVIMTSDSHKSGTERILSVINQNDYDGSTTIVNWQGDEVTMKANVIDKLIRVHQLGKCHITTLAVPIERAEAELTSVVKVVTRRDGQALYFSRNLIPYTDQPAHRYLKHIGIYVYSAQTIRRFCRLPWSELEANEKLEQLRALEGGLTIRVVSDIKIGDHVSIDTQEDYQQYKESTCTSTQT